MLLLPCLDSKDTRDTGNKTLHPALPQSTTMSTNFPFLCILTDDPLHQTLCFRYWAVDNGVWREKFDAIVNESGISKPKMQNLLTTSCRAYLTHFPCDDCGAPLEVRNRSQYSPLTGRPIGFGRSSFNQCGPCATAARAAQIRANEVELAQHKARVTKALARTGVISSHVDYGGLSYVHSFFLYSVLVAANAGWKGNRIAPLDSQPGALAPTRDLSVLVYKALYEEKIIAPDPASAPQAFQIGDEEGITDFAFESVGWLLAPDAHGRRMQDVFSLLLARLDDPEPDAIEELWYMIAESECRSYFLKQCERYRFVQPDIYSAKVADAVRDFLPRFSIGQMWNIIFYVLKDMAALSQEKTYARQHVYNMIPGNIRRYLEYRLSNNRPIHPWRRPAPITEAWMSSILFDKVLGDGNTSFETLTGQSIKAHVEFSHQWSRYDPN